jgi:hypothetical protein
VHCKLYFKTSGHLFCQPTTLNIWLSLAAEVVATPKVVAVVLAAIGQELVFL